MESDNSENESEEEEDTEVAKMDSEAPQATDCLEDNIPPKLSKEQEKKLRQLRKMDYSWASVL